MALADLAQLDTKTPPAGFCGVCWTADQLGPELAADLEAALANRAAKLSAIAYELNALGYPIGTTTVERHAKGECSKRQVYRP